METKFNRRNFLINGAKAGAVGCALFLGLSKLNAMQGVQAMINGDELIDPAALNYCGYTCPEKCQWRVGTLTNNLELKKEGYEKWKIKERFGLEFDEETMFCYGCKADGKPDGIILKNCTVRSCCKEKGYDCCIECDELTDCDKDLWSRFPDFKKMVIELQKKYQAQS